jgi:hypothetical protein
MRRLKIDSSHTSNGCTITTYPESHGLDGKETMRIMAYKFCNIFWKPHFAIWSPICSFKDAGIISLNRMSIN